MVYYLVILSIKNINLALICFNYKPFLLLTVYERLKDTPKSNFYGIVRVEKLKVNFILREGNKDLN
jgi:hypothetical protein